MDGGDDCVSDIPLTAYC